MKKILTKIIKNKKLRILGVLIFLSFLLIYTPIAIYISSHMYDNNAVKSDVAIVLGCKSFDGNQISQCIYSRVGKGAELYKNGVVKKLILSGGNDFPDNANEAEVMKTVALMQGVKDEDILLEKKATDSYENLLYSYNIAKENNLNKVILVTELYHLPRVNLLANKLGIAHTYAPATDSECWSKYEYLSGCFMKEPLSMILNWVEGRI
jgi:uncharacterized SAM-binding protein YcdF (DUF218 family)